MSNWTFVPRTILYMYTYIHVCVSLCVYISYIYSSVVRTKCASVRFRLQGWEGKGVNRRFASLVWPRRCSRVGPLIQTLYYMAASAVLIQPWDEENGHLVISISTCWSTIFFGFHLLCRHWRLSLDFLSLVHMIRNYVVQFIYGWNNICARNNDIIICICYVIFCYKEELL